MQNESERNIDRKRMGNVIKTQIQRENEEETGS
jgi:hypothetical protein